MSLLDKWRLARQIAEDRRLSRADMALGVLLLDLYNDAKGCAWPSLEWMATAASIDRSTATRSVARLIDLGYFERTSGGGRGRASHYRPRFQQPVNRRADAPDSVKKQARQRTETGAPVYENRCTDAQKQVRGRATTTLKSTITNPPRERGARTQGEDLFYSGRNKPIEGQPRDDVLPSHHRRRLDDPAPRHGDGVPLASTGERRHVDLTEWQPSAETAAWASEHAANVDDPLGPAIVEKFRNYHLARDHKFADPDAAYRKWLSDEPSFRARNRGSAGGGRDEILARAARAAAAVHRNRQ
jgi:hypothetical protein